MKKYFGIAALLAIVSVAVAQTVSAPAPTAPRGTGPFWQSAELSQLRAQTLAATQRLAQLNADTNADPAALVAQAQEVDRLRAQLTDKTVAERDAYLSAGGTCPGYGNCGLGQCGSGPCGMGMGACGMGPGQGMGQGACGMGRGQGMGMGQGMGRGMGQGQGMANGQGQQNRRGNRRGGGQGNGGVCPNQPTN